MVSGAESAGHARNDPALLTALSGDPQLHSCGCILAAAWLDESYPRVTVDAARWRKLGVAARARLSARALKIAEATYLTESAATDQYEQIFIVDRRGKVLSTYQP
jgi:hypothetical protein